MSRWLFVSLCAVSLFAFTFVEPTRAPDAGPLSGACQVDRQCQEGLQCTYVDGVMRGQCAATCNSTPSCQERFGEQSMCLGADLCARTCEGNLDCPSGNLCNVYGWCEAAQSE